MKMTEIKYTPDPTKGGEHVEARRAEAVKHLKLAVDVAYYHIDQQLERDIADLKKRAGEQKAKMLQFVKKAEELPALTVVRKYWEKGEAEIVHHLTETIMRNGE